MAREIVIYADESVSREAKFSNFYGGCLVESHELLRVQQRLEAKKRELNFYGEIKWQKVTANYLGKYEALMSAFFDEVQSRRVKVRIMFTQNRRDRIDLAPERLEDGYFKLYYQFIKHEFGLTHAPTGSTPIRVRLLFDEMPDQLERRYTFRQYLASLSKSAAFRKAGLVIDPSQIAEVRSHDHVLLQCTDVVLGAMQFRLNDKHRLKPVGASRRGKRTVAKEKLYRTILERVQQIRPRFNIGISTGDDGDRSNRWHHPYRHWLFQSSAPEEE